MKLGRDFRLGLTLWEWGIMLRFRGVWRVVIGRRFA